jgi:hypothetical protein
MFFNKARYIFFLYPAKPWTDRTPFHIPFMYVIILSELHPTVLPGHKKVSSLTLGPLLSTLESRNFKVSGYDSNYQQAPWFMQEARV